MLVVTDSLVGGALLTAVLTEDYYYKVTNVPGLDWELHDTAGCHSDGQQLIPEFWKLYYLELLTIEYRLFERYWTSRVALSVADKTEVTDTFRYYLTTSLPAWLPQLVGVAGLVVAGKAGLQLTRVGQFKLGLRGKLSN